ncbi:WD40-repeat-containing domain protein [Sordaria brevicollis]|uniref:Pre-rRNA-processing protein IPI3 n=1 Tax=Sordaria brevicollis TaxID=83679 RepID=A0AAE0U359_SORBR|nr:WD40-repeat-containing domain protein [Sordaria brevicollis]
MLSEEFVSAICGAPLSSNTSIAKDVGIYGHTLSPTYSVKYNFKKSSAPVNCVAVSENHVYAAQENKAYVHVYSRIRGNQEAFVAFPERIRCLTLAGDVLILGTAEGRLMLWETSTGRLISTPARHVQPVSCVVATPFHVLTGSDDSDIHVWSLSSLLELTPASTEHEPERSLSNHRAAITALSISASLSYDTNLAVSASKDKSCIVWNYQTGDALRTLLFPSFPLCMSLDPAARAIIVGCEDSNLYMAEFFKGEKSLLGAQSEDSATVMQISSPFGLTQSGSVGLASCLAFSYDGTTLLTGHPRGQIMKWDVVDNKAPVELTNLNAAVTNLVFVPPAFSAKDKMATKTTTIVKPNQAERAYTVTTQLEADLRSRTRVDELVNSTGFSRLALENAVAAFQEALAEKEGEKKE